MILVYGETGQVARELQRRAPDAIYLGRNQADLTDPKAAAMHILEIKPDVVINAAAYTAVDKAEEETLLAHTVNGDAVGAMAQACAALSIPLVHISTDYVFPGDGETPWEPGDTTGPLGTYGASKLAGERAIAASGCTHAILRTSWVFSAHGANFVKSMLKFGAERDEMKIVDDQIGGPTPAADIAAACLKIAKALQEGANGGVFHFSGAPDVSWADFACEIFSASGLNTKVEKIPSAEYPTPAERPKNSRLNCISLTMTYGIERPDWRIGLQDVLKELGAT